MRLKELIERTNTKQRDLCAAADVAHSTMSQYVNGQREPGINTLIKLADYFGVTVDYLIGHDAAPDAATPRQRDFIYVNDKKYELTTKAVKMKINGVNVRLSFEDAE